jgi:hypothetical protein
VLEKRPNHYISLIYESHDKDDQPILLEYDIFYRDVLQIEQDHCKVNIEHMVTRIVYEKVINVELKVFHV